jgi:hypothetical protein
MASLSVNDPLGFTPRSNRMGFAQSLGIFLSMYVSVEGKGAECFFHGDAMVWKNLHRFKRKGHFQLRMVPLMEISAKRLEDYIDDSKPRPLSPHSNIN